MQCSLRFLVAQIRTQTHRYSLAQSFMSDLDMDAAQPPLDLSNAPLDVITMVLQRMSLNDRFTCGLVCKAWAGAATAATRSIILEHRVQDLCLQRWLEKHGDQVEVLQLHESAPLTPLPCPQLQDLLLQGSHRIGSGVWTDIAAATKLTSVSLFDVLTYSDQAHVVSAIAALPDLQQLTWRCIHCSGVMQLRDSLSDSFLLKRATQLTALYLSYASAEALEHLGSLTKLQHLGIFGADDWAAAGCPGLQELKALTRLDLTGWDGVDAPDCISQLTALQQLKVSKITPTALNWLQALTGLTQLMVTDLRGLSGMSPVSPPLLVASLKHLKLRGCGLVMPMSYLEGCTRLQVLELHSFSFTGHGSLVATGSTSLQHLNLCGCGFRAADGAADAVPWQQVFPGPGQLPHLTSLELSLVQPALQEADMECVVATCNNLQVLHLWSMQVSFAPAMAQVSALTSLHLMSATDEQCWALAQLTGLREIRVTSSSEVSLAGLRQLVVLEQLTSLGFGSRFDSIKVSSEIKEHMSDTPPGCLWAHVIINKAPAGRPSDVSTRLLQACNVAAAAGHSER